MLDDKSIKEQIICAANWYKDLLLKDDSVLRIRGISPYNVDKGIVFSGWRHASCMYQMIAVSGLRQYEAGEEIQGFLTNKNRFVDREEGAKIHTSNGGKLHYSNTLLYSEDLY